MKKSLPAYLRWCVAGLLAVAVTADVLLVRHVAIDTRKDGLMFLIGGLFGIALACALALVLAPRPIRPGVAFAVIICFGWFGAFIIGSMFAGCDEGMRPFILQLFALMVPALTVIYGVVFAIVPTLLVAGYIVEAFASRLLKAHVYAISIAAIPVVGAVTFLVEGALGVHPTPGSCVI